MPIIAQVAAAMTKQIMSLMRLITLDTLHVNAALDAVEHVALDDVFANLKGT